MLKREDWLELARKLDWEFSYVKESEVYPEPVSGTPWLSQSDWKNWDEPYKTSYSEYVSTQSVKELSVKAVCEAIGSIADFKKLPVPWMSALKLHSALLPLAEFAAVIGNLRAVRFGRDSAWRTMATLGALDELRHTQIPLQIMHELVKWDPQFDWTQRFYHSNNWVAIAGKHFADELLVGSDPIEFAIATNFVFETGFTNLQFVGLSSLAHWVGDKMFENMANSIQSDEARHSQIGAPVLAVIARENKEYAQYLLDKWFWRSWLLFSITTGFCMDYFTPLESRKTSFKEFMEEWVVDQFLKSLEKFGLKKPWYWDQFLSSLDTYHHQVYASAYTYRATVWFDFVLPSPAERAWLKEKYPKNFDDLEKIWMQIEHRWKESDVGNDFAVHGTSIIGFCDLCQLVLCGGTPKHNTAVTLNWNKQKYIFCSDVCKWIFEKEPNRYEKHRGLVKRVVTGEAPGNVIELIQKYFGLKYETWGKDMFAGAYEWIQREKK